MTIEQLVSLTKEMVSTIEDLDGYIFLDRFDEGRDGLRKKALIYETFNEAQSWMNIVLVDQTISQIIGDNWSLEDPAVDELLVSIEKAWTYQVMAKFPHVKFSISRIVDPEYGDVGLKLVNVISVR